MASSRQEDSSKPKDIAADAARVAGGAAVGVGGAAAVLELAVVGGVAATGPIGIVIGAAVGTLAGLAFVLYKLNKKKEANKKKKIEDEKKQREELRDALVRRMTEQAAEREQAENDKLTQAEKDALAKRQAEEIKQIEERAEEVKLQEEDRKQAEKTQAKRDVEVLLVALLKCKTETVRIKADIEKIMLRKEMIDNMQRNNPGMNLGDLVDEDKSEDADIQKTLTELQKLENCFNNCIPFVERRDDNGNLLEENYFIIMKHLGENYSEIKEFQYVVSSIRKDLPSDPDLYDHSDLKRELDEIYGSMMPNCFRYASGSIIQNEKSARDKAKTEKVRKSSLSSNSVFSSNSSISSNAAAAILDKESFSSEEDGAEPFFQPRFRSGSGAAD